MKTPQIGDPVFLRLSEIYRGKVVEVIDADTIVATCETAHGTMTIGPILRHRPDAKSLTMTWEPVEPIQPRQVTIHLGRMVQPSELKIVWQELDQDGNLVPTRTVGLADVVAPLKPFLAQSSVESLQEIQEKDDCFADQDLIKPDIEAAFAGVSPEPMVQLESSLYFRLDRFGDHGDVSVLPCKDGGAVVLTAEGNFHCPTLRSLRGVLFDLVDERIQKSLKKEEQTS